MHPGKNRTALENKRNRLLQRLLDAKLISAQDHALARLEPIPARPSALPRLAPHLLEEIFKGPVEGHRLTTSINGRLQELANQTATFHSELYRQADIQNLGILILDTQSGEVLAYVGNAPQAQAENCLLYTSPSPRDQRGSRMPSSA